MKLLIALLLLAAPTGFVLPEDDTLFTGPDADLLNANCASCHGATMVLYQPRMTEAQWTASVVKMRTVYKAPVSAEDAARLPKALVRIANNN